MRSYIVKTNVAAAADTTDATHLGGQETNSALQELKNAGLAAAITLANAAGAGETLFQLGETISKLGGGAAEWFGTSAGSGAAFTLTSPSPQHIAKSTAYFNGMVISFQPHAYNTATAFTVNVNGLGAKVVLALDGSACSVADIWVGATVTMVYDGTNFILMSPNQAGAIGGNVTNGYHIFPRIAGIASTVIQWGTVSVDNTGTNTTFPIAFPTACLAFIISDKAGGVGASPPYIVGGTATSVTNFNCISTAPAADTSYWMAIGH